jgi:hypothetical protein
VKTLFSTLSLSILLSGLCAPVAVAQADTTNPSYPPKAPAKPVLTQAPEPAVAAGVAYLELSLSSKHIDAMVEGPQADFLGLVLLSPTPTVATVIPFLPPLLVDGAVMGIGTASNQILHLSVPRRPGLDLKVYGQALITDGKNILVSGIVAAASGPGGA